MRSQLPLATKYRPNKWKDVAGQEHAVAKLRGMIAEKRIPNAILFVGGTGVGKCIVGSTLINTTKGLIPIEDLIHREGYYPTSYSQAPQLLNAYNQPEYPSHTYKHRAKTIKITTSWGYSVEGTYVHPLLCIDGISGQLRWKVLSEMQHGDYLLHPSYPPHEGGTRSIPESSHVSLITASPSQVVPKTVLRGSENVKAQYLQQYFANTGVWTNQGVESQAVSPKLISQLQILLLEMGVHSSIKKLQTSHYRIRLAGHGLDSYTRNVGFLPAIPVGGNPDATPLQLPGPLLKRIQRWILRYNSVKLEGKYAGSQGAFSIQPLTALLDCPTVPMLATILPSLEAATSKLIGTAIDFDLGMQQIIIDLGYIVSAAPLMDRVTNKQKSGKEKWVYDFTLPNSHSFQANGFVNHNTTLGRLFARYLNCETSTACGTCVSCKAGINGNPNVTEMNAADTRGIDAIRGMASTLKLRPSFGALRIIILDEIQALTSQAWGALLKPLEEMPASALVIMCTTNPEKIPDTVIGRCAVLRLSPLTASTMKDRLKYIAKKEKMTAFLENEQYLSRLANASGGHMRDAVQLLEAAWLEYIVTEDLGKVIEVVTKEITDDTKESLKIILGMLLHKPKVVVRTISRIDNTSTFLPTLGNVLNHAIEYTADCPAVWRTPQRVEVERVFKEKVFNENSDWEHKVETLDFLKYLSHQVSDVATRYTVTKAMLQSMFWDCPY